ncbi:MAG TPA: 2-amino-4-hydroxy-6-hydroxymethyldihydropteridine diphosphokinase [Anaerolineales bacterium]|nr:2-amino-4-hydroxy-6-hydroxymethyldihydropteridine diphosphokinase [Anaerolineales bacterium]
MHEHIVYVALGSNLGDRLVNLKQAIASLSPQIEVRAKSRVYETPPWGHTDQPAFLNQVIKGNTYVEPVPLIKHLKRLEIALGRVPSFQNGPRLIDLDILFYDELILNTPPLLLPHPRLQERGFVLMPLSDIAPNLVHPTLRKTVSQMLESCDTNGIQVYEKSDK